MTRVRVVALGAVAASDDGAALAAVRRLGTGRAEIIEAGRPGPGLLDLLDTPAPVVLADVTLSALAPGTITAMALGELVSALRAAAQTSSHGFGPAETLRLGEALGRRLPEGEFVGIEGQEFTPGETLSALVAGALDDYATAIEAAVDRLYQRHFGQNPAVAEETSSCTNPG